MGKDKDSKKEKKSKKIKSAELATALSDPANTSTDIILADQTHESIAPDDEDLYDSRLAAQAKFAQPLANRKLNKKVLKTIKKGRVLTTCLTVASQAKELRRGVKEVVKALRKGEKGCAA